MTSLDIYDRSKISIVKEFSHIYSERLETGLFRITLHPRLLEEVGDVSSNFWLVKSNV